MILNSVKLGQTQLVIKSFVRKLASATNSNHICFQRNISAMFSRSFAAGDYSENCTLFSSIICKTILKWRIFNIRGKFLWQKIYIIYINHLYFIKCVNYQKFNILEFIVKTMAMWQRHSTSLRHFQKNFRFGKITKKK